MTQPSAEAGFTLTELLAALVLASIAIAGIVNLTGRYASTSLAVREAGVAVRTMRTADRLLDEVARADPASLIVNPSTVRGAIGASPFELAISADAAGPVLVLKTVKEIRSVRIPSGARFVHAAPTLALVTTNGEILASVRLERTMAAACRFDDVLGACAP